MATGAEPVSSGNLQAVLDGAGLPRMETLFTGSSTTVTLSRPASEYSVLLVTAEMQQGMAPDATTFVMVPGSGVTRYTFAYVNSSNQYAYVYADGADLVSNWSIKSVVAVTF